jgi:DNA uptake protein ComE-like DNA-binding protein
MNINREPIKNWFGFNRRERRATFILLFIIVMIIGVRYLFPDSLIAIEDISGTIPQEERSAALSGKDSLNNRKVVSNDTYKVTKFKKQVKTSKFLPQKIAIVEINTSDSITLIKLPGIGPVLSARIIKFRRLLGGFARVEQLKEVYGLPSETYEMIKDRVYADSSQISRININSATFKEIIRLPYLEKYEVTSILKYRELKGRINNIGDLIDNKLLTTEKARKVNPYLKYDN